MKSFNSLFNSLFAKVSDHELEMLGRIEGLTLEDIYQEWTGRLSAVQIEKKFCPICGEKTHKGFGSHRTFLIHMQQHPNGYAEMMRELLRQEENTERFHRVKLTVIQNHL